MGFIHECWKSEARTDHFHAQALGLIGDFGDTFKAQVADSLRQEWVTKIAQEGRHKPASLKTRQNARWAQQVSQCVGRD
jgi:importin subunit beta-1